MKNYRYLAVPFGLLPASSPAFAVWPPDPRDVRGNPVMSSTFYGAAISLRPTFTTFKPDETGDISEDIGGSSSAVSGEFSSSDYRFLQQAGNDDAALVASAGDVRGAHLEAALHLLKCRDALRERADLERAQALLALPAPLRQTPVPLSTAPATVPPPAAANLPQEADHEGART